ncbi:response regulator transcription factor [Candidatus Enterococcus murrayae]|uniref:Response regulator transcription factor n=1 Tax=Candidatus Enterococcus murrayae TaxID=2815321 RepID=A0ABS3HII1_9ENTE|nr:response regulator transcription factor [Enterococcus sp. MJM16]MBO0453268.1 response regulator transcription factor [Enterococcus sp. MJM16]
MKVLIIDDDPAICSMLKKVMEKNSWECIVAYDGLAGIDYLEKESFDLVFLDLNLPYKSGDSVLVKLRTFSDVPVIIISAKELVTTKVDLLKIGADDYVTKPFDIDELTARAEAVLRRNTPIKKETFAELRHGQLTLNREERRAVLNQQELQLTSTEFEILALLMLHPNKVFSKQNIFESVWQDLYRDDGHTINVHVSSLRTKLAAIAPESEYIETVWGVGYRLGRLES